MSTNSRSGWLSLGILTLSLGVAACGGDDGATGGAAGGDASACPSLGGSWMISQHCSTALVGMAVPVTQDGCSITTGGTFAGFTGAVQADGSFVLHGTSNGMSVSCGGIATAKSITETCNSDCAVTLKR
jgi:hypothetical protein